METAKHEVKPHPALYFSNQTGESPTYGLNLIPRSLCTDRMFSFLTSHSLCLLSELQSNFLSESSLARHLSETFFFLCAFGPCSKFLEYSSLNWIIAGKCVTFSNHIYKRLHGVWIFILVWDIHTEWKPDFVGRKIRKKESLSFLRVLAVCLKFDFWVTYTEKLYWNSAMLSLHL